MLLYYRNAASGNASSIDIPKRDGVCNAVANVLVMVPFAPAREPPHNARQYGSQLGLPL